MKIAWNRSCPGDSLETTHCKKKGAAINGKKVLAFETSYKPFGTVYYTFINHCINLFKYPKYPFSKGL